MPPRAEFFKKSHSRQRRGKPFLIAVLFSLLAILFSFFISFSTFIGTPLHALARPLWISRLAFVRDIDFFFTSKSALEKKNQALEEKVQALEVRLADHRLLEEEN